jgi:hypothetical protein
MRKIEGTVPASDRTTTLLCGGDTGARYTPAATPGEATS